MISKIFWAMLLLAVYVGLMLGGKDAFIKEGAEKIYNYVCYLLEDLEITR